MRPERLSLALEYAENPADVSTSTALLREALEDLDDLERLRVLAQVVRERRAAYEHAGLLLDAADRELCRTARAL